MNLPVVEMDPQEARRAFIAYRDEVRQRRDDEADGVRRSLVDKLAQSDRDARAAVAAEDEALMRAYRLVASGKRVISLSQTILEGGLDKAGYPKLGIARADQVLVHVGFNGPMIHFTPTEFSTWRNDNAALSKRFEVRGPLWSGPPRSDMLADVPRVPAWLRPKGDLSGYATLFEASWRAPRTTRAVGDPALLRPLGGDLFAVVAVWDLTPLESAVLGIANVAQ